MGKEEEGVGGWVGLYPTKSLQFRASEVHLNNKKKKLSKICSS